MRPDFRPLFLTLSLIFTVAVPSISAAQEGTKFRSRYAGEKNGPSGHCATEWQKLQSGLDYRKITCLGGAETDLHVVQVDPKRWELNASLSPEGRARAVAENKDAVFAINANFFDKSRAAEGVIVRSGKQVQGPRTSSWRAIFLVREDGTARIIPTSKWSSEKSHAWMAVEAGPRLVVDGHTVKVKENYAAARCGVCVQKNNKVIFFATPSDRKLMMAEIVRITRRDEEDGGLACRDAMLFDGGHSTQLYLETLARDVSITGDPVPVFVYGKPKE